MKKYVCKVFSFFLRFSLLIILLFTAGCSNHCTSLALPLQTGQASLVATYSYSLNRQQETVDASFAVPSSSDFVRSTAALTGEYTVLYYQLPSLVAVVSLIPSSNDSGLPAECTSLYPFLPKDWSSLLFSVAEDDGYIYHATVTDGEWTVNIRLASSVEVHTDHVELQTSVGSTYPLQCTPQEFASALVALDVPALLSNLSIQ